MAQQYKTGLIITGDASGGIRASQAGEEAYKILKPWNIDVDSH